MIYQVKTLVYTLQLTSGKHFRAGMEWPTVSLAELDGRTVEPKTQKHLLEAELKFQKWSEIAGSWIPILSLLLLCLLPCRLRAQIDAGKITGTVHDTSGAAIVAAKVTLTNEATGVSAATQSTSTGTYVFDAVKSGTYTI
jgi:hypothetical protein